MKSLKQTLNESIRTSKGNRNDYDYAAYATFDTNGEHDYFLSMSRENAEKLLPQLKGKVQERDANDEWGFKWDWKDMAEMLKSALESDRSSQYFEIHYKPWQSDDMGDELLYFFTEATPSASAEEEIKSCGRWLEKSFRKYYKELNIEDFENDITEFDVEQW